MPREVPLPPYASSLMESMRSVGYSLEAALADLVDNSISAQATRIDIQFRPHNIPYLAIIDNGTGMSVGELDEAMRHGSRSPLQVRAQNDLGRYGLGLKTASLSQCRRLTVVSLKDSTLSARCWDLDFVSRRNEWIVLGLDEEEIRELPHVDELLRVGRGTLVLWQQLDRLLTGESSVEVAFGHKMDIARQHLSKVFHRYLSGEPGIEKVAIAINLNPIPQMDPFLESHRATQRLDEERFLVDGEKVAVKPFILPHISKLSASDLLQAGGQDDLRNQQGFYVYRNRRLIIWGTWFRLAKKNELSKLARVRVDIPNSLDHLWTLDIKKSTAHPPEAVRTNLARTVGRIAERSHTTYNFRGRTITRGDITHGWERIVERDGVRYGINRKHPAIAGFLEVLGIADQRKLEALLVVLEASFPVDALYADMAADIPTDERLDDPATELRSMARTVVAGLDKTSVAYNSLINHLTRIEPFCRYPELAKTISEELRNEC